MREIEKLFAFPDTFSYSKDYLDFETYIGFMQDTMTSLALSLLAVLGVLLFITGSFQVTLLVMFSILLVDVFLYALIYYWGLTFNNILVIQIVVALGLSIDYSAHIAHTYLVSKPPNNRHFRGNNSKKRLYKAKTALS